MKVIYISIIFLLCNYVCAQTSLDTDWEIGNNWKVDVTVYRSFYGKPHQPQGPTIDALGNKIAKSWREEWDSIKQVPLLNFTVDIGIIDTSYVLDDNCWLFEYSSDTTGKNYSRAGLYSHIVSTISNPTYSWIDQETLEMKKGEGIGRYQKMYTSKFGNYQLSDYPGHGSYPSFISLFIVKDSLEKDSLRIKRDPSVGISEFRYIEQMMEVTQDGYIFYTKYVKNPGRKPGELRSPGYFDREVVICWEKGESWWSSYKFYVDGELQMEAYLIE